MKIWRREVQGTAHDTLRQNISSQHLHSAYAKTKKETIHEIMSHYTTHLLSSLARIPSVAT